MDVVGSRTARLERKLIEELTHCNDEHSRAASIPDGTHPTRGLQTVWRVCSDYLGPSKASQVFVGGSWISAWRSAFALSRLCRLSAN